MDLIVTLIVGALIGWIASMIMHTDAQMGAIANIIVGIIGSWLGSWFFGNVLGIGAATTAGSGFNLVSLFWGVVGAVVLIGILKALNLFGDHSHI